MPNLTHEVTLVASAAKTATGNSGALTLPTGDLYTFLVSVTAVSGTSPTMDIVFQNTPDDGTTWVNMPLRTSQITAARAEYFSMPQTGIAFAADSSVTAATGGILSENYVFSRKIRILWTIGGTSPSFTTAVYAWIKTLGRGC